MKVERLTLRNFRNVPDATLLPTESINFLVGSNGQGKTSFIEAIGFLSSLRSFRESKSAAVIRWGTPSGEISCSLVSDDPLSPSAWRTDLRVQFQITDPQGLRQKASKTAYINSKAYKSSTQYLVQRFGSYELGFHSVIFNPSDHDLVRGEPSIRRGYLDRALSAENSEYLQSLQKYHRVLEQRNALLKNIENRASSLYQSFTEQLCHYGLYLTSQRLRWIQRLNAILAPTLRQIAPRQPELKVAYTSNWAKNLSFKNRELSPIHFTGQENLPSLELLEQSFWASVSSFEAAEWRTGHSLVGPHRDDWTFYLGDQVLKGHGSQGEVRSALLALKLSEIELFRNETGHRPIFLLDDFSSELDGERRAFLMQFLTQTDLQTFVTTTEDTVTAGKRYWVCNGMIKEGSHDNRTESVRLE